MFVHQLVHRGLRRLGHTTAGRRPRRAPVILRTATAPTLRHRLRCNPAALAVALIVAVGAAWVVALLWLTAAVSVVTGADVNPPCTVRVVAAELDRGMGAL